MLTVVSLLLLPVILGMSVFRMYRIPQSLWLGQLRINPRRSVFATLSFGLTYLLLLAYTAIIIYSGMKAMANPPNTIHELFSLIKIGVGYPFVYLGFEWTFYYSIKPGPRATAVKS